MPHRVTLRSLLHTHLLNLAALLLSTLLASTAHANVAWRELPARGEDGPVTVFYPSETAEQTQRFGPFGELSLAAEGEPAPAQGNGRLVLISHGSGGGPWGHAQLAQALVRAGFVVAVPWHRADNSRDPSRPGPDSWKLRPAEMSRAIDAVAADAPLARFTLDLNRVGAYGMSAGGHTVLSLAGGRWSPAGFKRHCDTHLAEDFQFCVGLITRLNGGGLDGLKQWLARRVLAWRFADDTPQAHEDPRIRAVVAAVPAAADFGLDSLAQPRIPLALLTARQDAWLHPQWHSDAVLQRCRQAPRQPCEQLADLPQGGHGAYLAPLPAGLDGLLGDLLNDPPGFDRAQLNEIDARVVRFFQKHLLQP